MLLFLHRNIELMHSALAVSHLKLCSKDIFYWDICS